MRCHEVKPLLADHQDGLLGPAEHEEIDRHLAGCEACAAMAGEVTARLAVLYRADKSPPPPADLVQRILRTARPARRAGVRVILRYAAVFLAGAGVALTLRPEPRVIEVPVERVVLVKAAPEESPVVNHDVPRVPRRIR